MIKFTLVTLSLISLVSLTSCNLVNKSNNDKAGTSTPTTTELANNETPAASPPSPETTGITPPTEGIPVAQNNDVIKDWVDFQAADGSYSVKFPKSPEPQEQTQNANGLDLKFIIYSYSDNDNKRAFLTNSITYKSQANEKVNPDEVLDSGVNGFMAKVKGEKIRERKITVQGLPGREFEVKTPEGFGMLARMIFDSKGPSLYQVLIVTENGNVNFPEAKPFLDSFKITPVSTP